MQLFLCAVLAYNFMGCAAILQSAILDSLMEDVATAAAEHDDPRLVAAGTPTLLLLLDGLLEANPQDQQLLMKATEAYASYAALVEVDEPVRARGLYLRAKKYGLRALSQRLHDAQRLSAPYAEFTAITEDLEIDDLPLVFWTATSWGAWINTNLESMAALAEMPKVITLMQWVLTQDETFNHGSPHVFLGVYHSALPQMLGGDPEKAAEHFDRAMSISRGQQLMAYVLKAKFYARQTFDRALYESLLKQTLASPVDAVPELTLQNKVAQKQARILLSQMNDIF